MLTPFDVNILGMVVDVPDSIRRERAKAKGKKKRKGRREFLLLLSKFDWAFANSTESSFGGTRQSLNRWKIGHMID